MLEHKTPLRETVLVFPPRIIYWLEVLRLVVRCAACGSLHTQPVEEGMCWQSAPLARGRWHVCGAFQIDVLPSLSNQKWLVEDPKNL